MRTDSDEIVCADNLGLMRSLESGSCDLIYVDPPFNSNRKLGPADGSACSFDDRHAGGLDGYLRFLRPRLVEMHRLLSTQGSLCVHLDWRTVHYVKVMLDELFGFDCFLNEIIWSYRSGGRPARWFPRKHDVLLLYAKEPGKHTFNTLRGGTYRTRDLRMADDGTPYKMTRAGKIEFNPEGPAIPDVWDMPILSTVSRERTSYPTQKPEALLTRVIQASSNEGDLVADFFCGSGTALVAAKRLGRNWLGCDINPEAVAITQRRLDQVDLNERSA
jgi:site-specific DNA-methyltransferase (adenine-specific)